MEHFFQKLNDNEISYCVLRNYEELPVSTNGSDLDILIKKNQLSLFHKMLTVSLIETNGAIVSIIESKICPRYCILGLGINPWGLMIDLHLDKIIYRSQTIISEEAIWENAYLHNSICVLNQRTDKLIALIKELLNNNTCSEKYYNSFVEEGLDENFLHSIFKSIGKLSTADTMMYCGYGKYNQAEIERLVKQLDRDFPEKWYSPFLKACKLKRLLNKPGYTIALLGTDGSGKSTLIENITYVLNETFHNAVYYKHLRPGWLPPLSHLSGREQKQDGPVINPHASQPSGFLGSLMRWVYYFVDYLIGYYVKIFPKKATKACAFIFDRYYYDYYIDKCRARINLPDWIIRLGQALIPEPDIILCLGTDPITIHNRKPELPLPEIDRQITALKKFCSRHNRAIWIDTGLSIEESSKDALKEIMKMMAKRFEYLKLQ